MKIVKRILLILLIALVIIQFFHPAKNVSTGNSSNDIAEVYNVPADVKTVLNKACNDCHSNNTRYPWYNNLQPVAWWLDDHVQEGKSELNFNEFKSYRIGKQYRKMENVLDEVKKGDMPLTSYTLIHTNAKLTDKEKALVVGWAESIRNTIKAQYPADSLVRKKKA